ncbi:hypothetical protein PV10_09112 [Exophiala mesophila]|uniref:Exosome complex protein n=1 Tax=Exophiala mesophila TaxID=212818 RepID=A0A0D1ZN28_EXOME|nr:uncharacterized protein PV10_09112 [Exophiala mesophila]KIV88193.1 hypothetical protein PV10_09112 [Exophiala mesophila]
MDTKSVLALVDQLEEALEDLEDNLEPLLVDSLTSTTQKLPLLDRAKLNVLLVYAIESLIFSYLKVQGVQAKEHAVFRELSRVKQYFEKIKQAEAAPSKSQPTLVLDKDAAGRFIKHALAGNDRYDLERREREAREKLLAKRRLKHLDSAANDPITTSQAPENVLDDSDALAAAQEAARLIAMDDHVNQEPQDVSMSNSSDHDDDSAVPESPAKADSSSSLSESHAEPHLNGSSQGPSNGQTRNDVVDSNSGSTPDKPSRAEAKKLRKAAQRLKMSGHSSPKGSKALKKERKKALKEAKKTSSKST